MIFCFHLPPSFLWKFCSCEGHCISPFLHPFVLSHTCLASVAVYFKVWATHTIRKQLFIEPKHNLCLPACLSFCLSMSLPIYLSSIYLPIYLSMYLATSSYSLIYLCLSSIYHLAISSSLSHSHIYTHKHWQTHKCVQHKHFPKQYLNSACKNALDTVIKRKWG